MTNLEQLRARRAFAKAGEIAETEGKKDFLSLARSLPAMLQNNGLLATWAFLLSKDTAQHKAILTILLKHLRSDCFNFPIQRDTPAAVFIHDWTGQTPLQGPQLMRLTAEALAFSGWLKRASEALCNQ